jgi:hypothetical protein
MRAKQGLPLITTSAILKLMQTRLNIFAQNVTRKLNTASVGKKIKGQEIEAHKINGDK